MIAELEDAPEPKRTRSLKLLEPLPLLRSSETIDEMVAVYVKHKVMPAEATGDTRHLALAMTRRTGNARIVTEDVLAIHPADASRKQIATGDLVRIFSARGKVRIHAKVSDEVKPGILYTTFHFPEHLGNVVTSSECDEDAMCPEYKVVAVDVERVSAPVEKKSAKPETVEAK